MAVKELDALVGTEYEVNVTRDSDGDYSVEIYKPAHSDDPYAAMELVAHRYLEGVANIGVLNTMVREVIERDHPSLVGVYAYVKENDVS